MKVSIIAFTDNGMEIAYKLSDSLSKCDNNQISFTRCGKGELSIWTEEHFGDSDALVFIGAIGIALRGIAPYIKTKTKDPAISGIIPTPQSAWRRSPPSSTAAAPT